MNDLALIELLITNLTVETRARLAHLFTKSAIRRQRLAERDAAYRALAVGRPGTGSEIAAEIRRDLRRYNATAYQYERHRPPPADRKALMHKILTSSGGNVLSERALRRVLAGLSWPKSAPAMASDAAYPPSRKEPRGRDEGVPKGGHRATRRR